MTKSGKIYCGIGGWTYEPWRGVFYPKGLPHAQELTYAGEHLTAIEINGTFYRTQNAKTFRNWASQVPDGFVFSIKGVRYVVNRRVLAEAGDSLKRFLDSGVTELGDKLGPLLWQFAPFKKFDEASAVMRVSVATGITATVDLTGSAATTGQASIVIAYVTLPREA
jgi:uncharacterized protein YecE (DUF72 family)